MRTDVSSSLSFWRRSDYNIVFSNREILSNLPLQMSLFFNVFYFPLHLLLLFGAYLIKFPQLPDYYQVVSVIVIILFSLLEISRLYLGYRGNLGEQVPQLTGFCILTCLQIICCLYLVLNLDMVVLPVEISISIPQIMFLLSQLVCVCWALRKMAKAQEKRTILELISKRN